MGKGAQKRPRNGQAQDTVHQDRLTLAQVIDFLPDATFAIDTHRRVIAWNKAMEDLLGVRASLMMGRSDYSLAFYRKVRPMLVDLVLGADREIEKAYVSIERQGDTIVAEGDVLTPGGTVRLWGKASPIYDEKGSVIGAISSVRDITDRTRAEHSLRESRQMLGQMVDFLPDPTFAVDLQGRVMVWNKAMEELTGVPAGDMTGRSDYEYSLPFYGSRRPILIDLALANDPEVEKKYAILERKGDALLAETVVAMRGKNVHLWGKASPIYDTEGQVIGAIESIRDITERKLIEEELRASEVKIRDIFENVTDFLYVHDLEGRFIESNLIFTAHYGYTKGDLKNLNIMDIVHEEDRHLMRGILKRIISNGSDEGTFRIRVSDGSVRIIEYKNSLVRDENGGPAFVRGSARDVTERVLAEQGLRESEQRYRLLAENIRDVIWVADLNLRNTYVSPSVERLRGFTQEEAIGQNLEELLLPGSHEKVIQALSLELGREERGERHDPFWSMNLELQMRCKDGPPIWTEVTASFLRDIDGNPTHFLGITRDITERKKAEDSLRQNEERFRALFEHSAEASALLEDGSVVDCNQAAVDLVKAGSKEELMSVNPAFFSPEFQPDGRRSDEKAGEMVMEALAKGTHRFEWMHRKIDGAVFPAEVVLTEIPMGDKKLLFSTCRDLTEQRKAEDERRMYETRLTRSQKLEAIGTLAGGIAHDFNNILSAIIGYAELALDDLQEGSPARRCMSEVLKGGDRAKDLVSQILTFSRQIQAEKKVVNMGIILKEALKLLRSSIPSTIGIVQNILPGTPPVFADPTQVHQVIMNLCTNAYQAMMENGGVMTVTLGPAEVDGGFSEEHPPLAPGPHVLFTVQDTGHGMDQETMNRIFEPFFTTREKSRGTGLGLSTVHGIVTALSGTVMVASTVGRGSTFSVYLPAHGEDVEEEPVSPEAIPEGNGEKILMVDDETAILEFTKNMLEPLGYSVTVTSSSMEAYELFSSNTHAFDLVITDQTMPQLTGMELASKMLALRPDLPVILVSGYSETVSPEGALERGARAYLEKPFTRKGLACAIRSALGGGET
jgi:PAS domain S-box-containing protein